MSQRVLVVDVDQSILKVLSAYLEQSGYQVIQANVYFPLHYETPRMNDHQKKFIIP
jgi:DNA-binding response OmpR family regulator